MLRRGADTQCVDPTCPPPRSRPVRPRLSLEVAPAGDGRAAASYALSALTLTLYSRGAGECWNSA
ncbi:MAG: hypothetical protein ACK55Z_37835, partial [bacterium]